MTITALAPSKNRRGSYNPDTLVTSVNGRTVSVAVEMIGPAEAEQFLGKNNKNRNKKHASIAGFAADMKNGDWQFTGAAIQFDDAGNLQDGQNRMEAIVVSGETLPFIVVRGLDPAAQDDMDCGVKRTYGDVLTIRGEKNAHNVAALVRRVGAWEAGERRGLLQWKTSHSGLSRILAANPDLKEWVGPATRVASIVGLPASSVGMLMWVFHGIDSDDAEFFFDRLTDGQGLMKGDPIFELRRTLADPKNRLKGGNAKSIRDIVFIIKAWNSYRAGETVSLYRWKPGGATPEAFPEPV